MLFVYYALKFSDKRGKNFLCVSYSQNHSEVSRKYYVLTNLSVCTYRRKYVHSPK